MRKSVNILGTRYTLRKVGFGRDEYMDKMHFGGYCSSTTKEIVLLDLKTTPDWASELPEIISRQEKETLRHEIIHAFLNESGLGWNTLLQEQAWAKNEEMVDWIAIQFPKILKVFVELGCEGV